MTRAAKTEEGGLPCDSTMASGEFLNPQHSRKTKEHARVAFSNTEMQSVHLVIIHVYQKCMKSSVFEIFFIFENFLIFSVLNEFLIVNFEFPKFPTCCMMKV